MSNFEALKAALKKRAATRKAYACNGRAAAYNMPLTGWNKPDKNGNRWVETLEGAGLRFVNFADKIVSLNHQGWYSDTFQDGVYRGAVLQLPSRGGMPVYVAAYQESSNEGYRVLGGYKGLYLYYDESNAARAADHFAEEEAEEARNYDEAWQLGRRYADLGETIAETRTLALSLIREIKAAHKTFSPAICRVLRDKLASYRLQIRKARTERFAMKNVNLWWETHYADAFNDGAGETVFPVKA